VVRRPAVLPRVTSLLLTLSRSLRYSTGGSLDGLLEQLPEAELNLTSSNAQSTGKMFEKVSSVPARRLAQAIG
jgi:hypothetical protein